ARAGPLPSPASANGRAPRRRSQGRPQRPREPVGRSGRPDVASRPGGDDLPRHPLGAGSRPPVSARLAPVPDPETTRHGHRALRALGAGTGTGTGYLERKNSSTAGPQTSVPSMQKPPWPSMLDFPNGG